MHQKITGQIDESTHPAHSHSLETLKDWHSKNSHISKLVLSSQVIAPIISGGFLIMYFIYLIESNPANLGKKLNSQINSTSPDEQAAARSKIWIIVTISTLFTIGNIIADSIALGQYRQLPREIESYINDKSIAFAHLHWVPATMLIFDVVSSLFFIVLPICVVGSLNKSNNIQCSVFLYMLLSPLQCIATHSYHIIFAFINNPYHATSVLLRYIMILFLVVIILQKIYFLVHRCFKKESVSVYVCILVFYFVAIGAMALYIGLIVAVLIVLPITNAIDQASNEIYVIYQASLTVFAALITFEVFFRHTNSIFAVFIKAADKMHPTDEEWKEKSEKEKEEYLGEAILKHIRFQPPGGEPLGNIANQIPQETNSISTMLIKTADKCYPSNEEWKRKSKQKKEEYLGKTILTYIGFQPPSAAQQ
jgi:hypothetical protein